MSSPTLIVQKQAEPIQARVSGIVQLQVPLKLAWALTIHKCQGLTLDFARISLKVRTAPIRLPKDDIYMKDRRGSYGTLSPLDGVVWTRQ